MGFCVANAGYFTMLFSMFNQVPKSLVESIFVAFSIAGSRHLTSRCSPGKTVFHSNEAATTKGGRKIRVYAAGSTLEDLRSWFKQGARAKSTVDRAETALEATV